MSQRKLKLSWENLENILKSIELVFEEEEISEITLVEPKEILLHLTRPNKKETK